MGINEQKQNFRTCKFSSRPSPVRPSLLKSSHPTPSRTSRLRSKTRKVSHPISRDLSSPVSNSRMEEPSPTTTSRRNPLSISSSDSEVVCRSSLRLSPVRPSLLRSSHQTPSRTSRLRSRTRKESHPISRDSSSQESSLKTVEPFLITTSRRSPLFISSSDSEVVCRSSLRPSPVRPSPSKLSHLTPLRTSRQRSRTRKVSHPISKDLSSLESSSRMDVLLVTTTSRRSPPSILSLDSEVVCRSSSRPSLERPSLLRSSQATPSRTSRPRSRTWKASLLISRDSSSLESSLRTEEPFLITTSRRNLPSILSLDSVEASEAPTEHCIAPL